MRAINSYAGPFTVHPDPRDGGAELRDARGQLILRLDVDGAEEHRLLTSEEADIAVEMLRRFVAERGLKEAPRAADCT